MSNSSLVTYTLISPYKYVRQQKITGIIIHHMAGKLTAKQCGNVFQYAEASANYGIGYDGSVGLYVPENYSAWSAASYYYDQRNISIELSNDGGASTDWHVSDKVIAKCIDLCVDICKRNGIKKLNFTGDLSGNLIMHCYTASTACPGGYLKTKFKYIAEQVNAKLGGTLDTPKLKSATANTNGSITVKWEKVTGAYKYRVFRKITDGWKGLGNTTGTSYTDTTCKVGMNYTYTVRCIDKDGKYTSGFDKTGVSATAKREFQVEVTAKKLNIREGAGTNYDIVGAITDKGIYTITETKEGKGSKTGWGKLKSGAGWISLDYTKRV